MVKQPNPADFIDKVIRNTEKGEPFKLSPYQRRVLDLAFRRDSQDRLRYQQIVWSEIKKSGKTFLAACLALWWGFTRRHTEIIITANDLEQSISRVFKTMADLIEQNPALKAEAKVYSNEIHIANGTEIKAISSDYKGAAGSRHSLVVYDELWGFESEKARRLYEELTPPPSEASAWILVVTYAGFLGEADLLESIYQRGMAGRRIDEELECYEHDELFMFWSHKARQPWQDKAYYEQQRKILRPVQFTRLHENQWVSSESRSIDPAIWDSCVVPGLKPDPSGILFIGIDASVKHDSTALVAVKYDRYTDNLVLADHRIWVPSPDRPMDLEMTVEFYLRKLQGYRCQIERILCDPFQLHRSIVSLQQAGLLIEEYPQTLPNLTKSTEALYGVLNTRRLKVYEASQDLRAHVLNAASVEMSRGFRLSKERTSLKIDGAVALSFAVVAAQQSGKPIDAEALGLEPAKIVSGAWDVRRDSLGNWR